MTLNSLLRPALACVLASISALRAEAPAAKAPPAPPVPAASYVLPQPGRVRDLREYTARLAAPEWVAIQSRVAGHLEQVHFREGALVRRGDPLFTLDARPFEVELQRATAELARATRRAEQLEGEAKRSHGLAEAKAISVDESEQRRQQALEAAESVRVAEAAVAAAKLNLEYARIRSPIDGRIGFTRVTPGNYVTAGQGSAEPLATVVSVDPLHVLIEVDEATYVAWRAGAASVTGSVVRVLLPGRESAPAEAVVDTVDNTLNPRTGTLRVRAVLANPDGALSPGMSARAIVPVGAETDALLIPDRAVGSDLGSAFVWVADAEGVARHRKVVTGPLVNGLRAVRSGLTANDHVLVSGLMAVRNGQPVKAEPLVPATPSPAAPAPAAP